MSETVPTLKPEHPDQPASPSAQVKVEQQVGAVTGCRVVGTEVHHVSRVDDLFYEGLIRSYVDAAGFVDRPWLAQQVDEALADPGCRFLLLTAEPGAGKTAFVARLADLHPGWPRYFIRRDSQTPLSSGDARSFLFAVGHQLAALRPTLFHPDRLEVVVRQRLGQVQAGGQVVGIQVEDLHVSPFYRTALRVEQEAGIVAGELVGLSVKSLVTEPRFLELGNLAHLALLDPAQALLQEDPTARIVVAVDALDELRYYQGQESLLSWLAACPELPPNLRFILTSRPEELLAVFRRRQQAGLREEQIDPQAAEVRADLERCALNFATQAPIRDALAGQEIAADAFVDQAVTRADGNFQYLAAFFRGIEQALAGGAPEHMGRLLRLQGMPGGLADLYAFFLDLIKESVVNQQVEVEMPDAGPFAEPTCLPAWEGLYQPILGVLAVGREPLTGEQIRAFGQIRADVTWLDGALGRLGQFLDRLDGRYRLYHSTLSEFLTAPETRTAYPACYLDPATWHRRIAACYRGKAPTWAAVDWRRADDYGIFHLVAHLYALRENLVYRQELYALICVPFMREKEARTLSHRAFAEDLTLALEVARAEEPRNLSQVVRQGLIYATLGDLATHVPPETLGGLAQMGQSDKARGMAALIQDAWKQCQAYQLIAEALLARGETAAAREVLAQVVTTASRLDEVSKPLPLHAAAQALARAGDTDGLRRVLALAQAMQEEFWREVTLRDLAQVIAGMGDLDWALSVAGTISNEQFKTQALSGIARVRDEEAGKAIALGYADRSEAQADGSDDAAALVKRVVSSPERITPGHEQASALGRMAHALAQVGAKERAGRLANQAVEIAATLEDEWFRARALENTTPALAEIGDEAGLSRFLAAVETFTRADYQVEVLTSLAEDLAKAGDKEEATVLVQHSLDLARAVAPEWARSRSLAKVARVLGQTGENSNALQIARQALSVLEAVSGEGTKAEVLQTVMSVLAEMGDEAGVNLGMAIATAMGDERARVDALCAVATAFFALGRKDEAAEVASLALAAAEGIGDTVERAAEKAGALNTVALALAEMDDFHHALLVAERIPSPFPFERDHALRGIVRALARARDVDRAQVVAATIGSDYLKATALAGTVDTLAQVGRVEEACCLLPSAFAIARLAGRDGVFAALGASAHALAALDRGETLCRIHEVIEEVDGWWA